MLSFCESWHPWCVCGLAWFLCVRDVGEWGGGLREDAGAGGAGAGEEGAGAGGARRMKSVVGKA